MLLSYFFQFIIFYRFDNQINVLNKFKIIRIKESFNYLRRKILVFNLNS